MPDLLIFIARQWWRCESTGGDLQEDGGGGGGANGGNPSGSNGSANTGGGNRRWLHVAKTDPWNPGDGGLVVQVL